MKSYVISKSLIQGEILYLTLSSLTTSDRFNFLPGQYVALSFMGENNRPSPSRCFSIASSPNDNLLEFAIRIKGQYTQTLSQKVVGSKISILGPFGSFIINKYSNKGIICLAGGIGITPFMSMIREATQKQSLAPITLLYGCRNQNDIPYLNELVQLENQNHRFRVGFFVSSGEIDRLAGQNAFQGIVEDKWIKQITGGKYQNFSYYLCGPKSFMTGLTNTLIDSGVDNKQIFSESFSQTSKVKIFHEYTASSLIYKIATISLVVIFLTISGFDIKQSWAKLAAAQIAEQTSQSNPFVPALVTRSSLTNQDTSTPTPTSRKTNTQNNVRFTTATPAPTATPTLTQNTMNTPSAGYRLPQTMMS